MIAALTLATIAVVQNAQGAALCAGAAPAIVSVAVQSVSSGDGLNRYHLVATVVNRGRRSQSGNVLQSVDIVQDGNKVGEKGIPPLKAGESYSFTYDFLRSPDAGNDTTDFAFTLDMHRPSGISAQHCDASSDRYTLKL